MNKDIFLSTQQEKCTKGANAIKLYKDFIVGENKSCITLLTYESLVFLANFTPSIFGVGFRALIYKFFFKKFRKTSIFWKSNRDKKSIKSSYWKKGNCSR